MGNMNVKAKFSNPGEMFVELTLEMKLDTWMELSAALKEANIQKWPIGPIHDQLRDVIRKIEQTFYVAAEPE